MKSTYYLFLPLFIFLYSCGTEADQNAAKSGTEEVNEIIEVLDTARKVIQNAIEAQGGRSLDNALVQFTFRGRTYKASRKQGTFAYERIFEDKELGAVRDVLSNETFKRFVHDEEVALSSKDSTNYSNSVNSVIYFALLPYFLEDPAATPEYLGIGTIKSEPLHKVKITFSQEGGGKDFEDQFIYWFGQDDNQLKYLAYNYQTDDTGARFREAFNERVVNGVRFVDYVNYKPKEYNMDVASFDQLFEAGGLEELSKIELDSIRVLYLK